MQSPVPAWLATTRTVAPAMLALITAACCPSTAGPTAPAASFALTLAPGQSQAFDAETPAGTTQINLTFRITAIDAPIQLRQIDPACDPAATGGCHTFYETTMTARPAGVVQFGNTVRPSGIRTRIVLRNPSDTAPLTLSLTIEPHRAGCT